MFQAGDRHSLNVSFAAFRRLLPVLLVIALFGGCRALVAQATGAIVYPGVPW